MADGADNVQHSLSIDIKYWPFASSDDVCEAEPACSIVVPKYMLVLHHLVILHFFLEQPMADEVIVLSVDLSCSLGSSGIADSEFQSMAAGYQVANDGSLADSRRPNYNECSHQSLIKMPHLNCD